MFKPLLAAGALSALLILSGCLFSGEPAYAEYRLSHRESGFELLGFIRMDSMDDCESRRQRVIAGMTKSSDGWRASSAECKPAMPERYVKLFDNAPIQATYIALTRGRGADERDARLVFFGVPSSVTQKYCPRISEQLKRNYSGKITCIQGTVG